MWVELQLLVDVGGATAIGGRGWGYIMRIHWSDAENARNNWSDAENARNNWSDAEYATGNWSEGRGA
jgi:hypothetical protein